MRLRGLGELRLVSGIRDAFRSSASGLLTGIGDDAAVVAPPKGKRLVFTTDTMVEGVHFSLAYCKPRDIGFKSVSVNVSDVHAMAARPLYILMSISISPDEDASLFRGIMSGVRDALKLYRIALIGGDMTAAAKGALTITITAIGAAAKPALRSGARPGDHIYVTGPLGDSAMGLRLLQHPDLKKRLGAKTAQALINRHLRPVSNPITPAVARRASAMMDISDGLLIDLSRLCTESAVGAQVHESAVPISAELRAAAAKLRIDPLDLAMRGGEDYELIVVSRHKLPGTRFNRVGEIIGKGFIIVDAMGVRRKAAPGGFDHFKAMNKGKG